MPQTIQDLHDRVIAWATVRGIFEKATPASQHHKTIEEVGELVKGSMNRMLFEITCMNSWKVVPLSARHQQSLAHKNETKDAIGDIIVTLIIQCRMQDIDFLNIFNELDNVSRSEGSEVYEKFITAIGAVGRYIAEVNEAEYLFRESAWTNKAGMAIKVLNEARESLRASISAAVCFLRDIAAFEAVDMVECLTLALDVVEKRKGKMVNGQFVKESE